jgi:hypothetical protein
MSPFKALYEWPYHTSLSWSEWGKTVIFDPDIVKEVEEKVKQICANILTAQTRQKGYTGKRHYPMDLKWVIMYTFEFPQWKVYVALGHILSSTSMGHCLIKWSYHQSY